MLVTTITSLYDFTILHIHILYDYKANMNIIINKTRDCYGTALVDGKQSYIK